MATSRSRRNSDERVLALLPPQLEQQVRSLLRLGDETDADEAERAGLVSRVVPADKLMDEALAAAQQIASMSQPIVKMIKESINRAYEVSLAEGILFERRAFHSAFATEDQKEGMQAFIEKRPPQFKNR